MRKYLFIGVVFLLAILAGCGSNNRSDESAKLDGDSSEIENGFGFESSGSDGEEYDAETSTDDSADSVDRKIIHRAHLSVNVSDFSEAQQYIESKVEQLKGYVVETNVYSENDHSYGNLVVRIPAKDFRGFITDVENNSNRVLDRNITGDDVTEQYVDLESRLKSKRIVEERLIDFLGEAEKTEDLLKISSDLSVVQEEIEVLIGKINYLKNQVDFSTVEIHLYEDRIIMPHIDGKDLNTWEKTKQQFFKSINHLLSFGSALIIFVLGNFPVILLFLLGGVGFYYFVNTKMKKRQVMKKNDDVDHEDE